MTTLPPTPTVLRYRSHLRRPPAMPRGCRLPSRIRFPRSVIRATCARDRAAHWEYASAQAAAVDEPAAPRVALSVSVLSRSSPTIPHYHRGCQVGPPPVCESRPDSGTSSIHFRSAHVFEKLPPALCPGDVAEAK